MFKKLHLLFVPLILLALLALPSTPVRAQEETYGYLWSLEFDFTHSFNGILTIEVGPWQNGNLVSVDATSTSRVYCRPVGAVALNGGDAVFTGGHLDCTLDLAAIVLRNHGLSIAEVDSYGSMLFTSELETTGFHLAPIFSHADAAYQIDFSQTSSVTLAQTLDNQAGIQHAFFIGVVGANRHTYTMEYGCVWLGPCHNTFVVDAAGQIVPAAGGERISFATGPTRFRIGSDGASTFHGRIGHLLIDPGNSVH